MKVKNVIAYLIAAFYFLVPPVLFLFFDLEKYDDSEYFYITGYKSFDKILSTQFIEIFMIESVIVLILTLLMPFMALFHIAKINNLLPFVIGGN